MTGTDEGISGTSLKHRDEFNKMIADCRAGKIDMIITKSVSRFARNVEDFIGTVRNLAELKPRVGVFFESEAIFSLNDDSQMALTFQATMAEEESHTRSRSMETSLRMRLDHGIPLTPKLFGYTHDEEGELQINPEEAPTVKLMFYMYLYGYSTQQIADTLIAQERLSYFGKLCWTASGVASVLRNERHCGDVLTRKTYTENYRTHRTLKNYGEKPQSWYFNHHTLFEGGCFLTKDSTENGSAGVSMEEKALRQLQIDPHFKNLIRPLQRKEYLQLEQNILADGCRDPLIVWNGVIVDGHNRYEICMRHQIPFAVLEMDFSCDAEAIAWICANQLGRRNISEETRKFLIGKQYEAEKLIGVNKNPNGNNQYSSDLNSEGADQSPEEVHSRSKTAEKIAKENHISKGTVEKYAIYARAMDTLAEKDSAIVPKILSGQYKIAHKNVVELSKLSPPEIKRVERRIKKMQQPYIQYNQSRNAINAVSEGAKDGAAVTSIKDMPAFDPDADINVLTLTIPSWSSSIDRVRNQTDLSIISSHARDGLIKQLYSLVDHVSELLGAIEED